MSESLREKSRRNWTSDNNDLEYINIGCMLRIADATEVMAKDHQNLVSQVKWLRESNDRKDSDIAYLKSQSAAYKGHVNRLKKLLSEKGRP